MESSLPLAASLPAAAERPAARPPVDPARAGVDRASAERAMPTAASSLWDVLTPEERAVFERVASMGPLVYGADGRPATEVSVPTGRRIDLRG